MNLHALFSMSLLAMTGCNSIDSNSTIKIGGLCCAGILTEASDSFLNCKEQSEAWSKTKIGLTEIMINAQLMENGKQQPIYSFNAKTLNGVAISTSDITSHGVGQKVGLRLAFLPKVLGSEKIGITVHAVNVEQSGDGLSVDRVLMNKDILLNNRQEVSIPLLDVRNSGQAKYVIKISAVKLTASGTVADNFRRLNTVAVD